MMHPKEFLDEVNANNREVLYRCRWSASDAASVVPRLEKLLRDDDGKIVAEALRALHCIASGAFAAASTISTLLDHRDPIVSELATSTLGRVCFEHPAVAIERLAQAASHPALQKAALAALINFGAAAFPAVDAFCAAYESSDPVVRRLAVRGLVAVAASDARSEEVLRRAAEDTNGSVRKAARPR